MKKLKTITAIALSVTYLVAPLAGFAAEKKDENPKPIRSTNASSPTKSSARWANLTSSSTRDAKSNYAANPASRISRKTRPNTSRKSRKPKPRPKSSLKSQDRAWRSLQARLLFQREKGAGNSVQCAARVDAGRGRHAVRAEPANRAPFLLLRLPLLRHASLAQFNARTGGSGTSQRSKSTFDSLPNRSCVVFARCRGADFFFLHSFVADGDGRAALHAALCPARLIFPR